jgi:hypothetical protein
MTEQFHNCNYFCQRPDCIKRQRDEFVQNMPGIAMELARLDFVRDNQLIDEWHKPSVTFPDVDLEWTDESYTSDFNAVIDNSITEKNG